MSVTIINDPKELTQTERALLKAASSRFLYRVRNGWRAVGETKSYSIQTAGSLIRKGLIKDAIGAGGGNYLDLTPQGHTIKDIMREREHKQHRDKLRKEAFN